jgi:hypothetical protein
MMNKVEGFAEVYKESVNSIFMDFELSVTLTLSQQAIFFTTSDILIELFYNVNISARIHPPLKQRTPLKS